MVSLGRATFGLGPLQSSDCKTINGGGGPVTLWHLGHSLFQCPGCLQRAYQSQSSLQCPFCPHRVTLALYGYPWALGSVRARLAQKSQLPLWWSLSGQNHCHHLGLLHISLGVFSLFGRIPITENQINQLEQTIHWGLRTSSCFLNFAPDVWGRLGYEMHSPKGLYLGGRGIHIRLVSMAL